MWRHLMILAVLAAGVGEMRMAQGGDGIPVPDPAGGLFVAWQAMAAPPAMVTDEEIPQNSPPPGVADPNNPVVQQIDQMLQSVSDDQPGTREAAEEKLSALGDSAAEPLRDALTRYTGAKRAAVEAAIFRVSNGIKPREVLATWLKKNVEGLRAKQERISDPLLSDLFPHHQFYVLTFGEKAKLPASVTGIKPRTVIAMAADGKIDVITENPGLIKFLRVEALIAKSAGERIRLSEAVVILAAIREAGGTPNSEEIKSSEDRNIVIAEGANKKESITAEVTFGPDGKFAAINVIRSPAPEKEKKARGDDESKEPAESQPAPPK